MPGKYGECIFYAKLLITLIIHEVFVLQQSSNGVSNHSSHLDKTSIHDLSMTGQDKRSSLLIAIKIVALFIRTE